MKNTTRTFDRLFWIVFPLCIAYQILCCLHGSDLTDEGWAMTFYQQIFNDPQSVTYNFLYWMTGVIGGAWYNLWPGGGLLAMRLLGVAMEALIFFLCYKLLKPWFNSKLVLLGLVFQVFILINNPKPYDYNTLSALFFIASAGLLLQGIDRHNRTKIFLSGLLLGINVFVKITNLSGLGLILLIPLSYAIRRGNTSQMIKETLLMLGASLLGIGAVLLTMKAVGHLPYFIDSLHMMRDIGQDGDNPHSISKILMQYVSNYKNVLKLGGYIFLSVVAFSFILKWLRRPWLAMIFGVLTASFIAYKWGIHDTVLRGNDQFFVNFVGLLGLLVCFDRTAAFRARSLAVAGILMLLLLPLGSDGGFLTMGMGSWLAMPLGLGAIWSFRTLGRDVKIKGRDYHLHTYDPYTRWAYLIILLAFFIACVYKAETISYFDPGLRKEKTSTFDNKFCRHIHTGERRAHIINELMPGLEKYVRPGDYMLVFDFAPLLNYMTDTKPYVYNSWPWVYSGNLYTKLLERAEREIPTLPVVVVHNFHTSNIWSDIVTDKLVVGDQQNIRYNLEQMRATNSFLERHNYQIVWTNGYFDIYTPVKENLTEESEE